MTLLELGHGALGDGGAALDKGPHELQSVLQIGVGVCKEPQHCSGVQLVSLGDLYLLNLDGEKEGKKRRKKKRKEKKKI